MKNHSLKFFLIISLALHMIAGNVPLLSQERLFLRANQQLMPLGDTGSLSSGSLIARQGSGEMAWYNPAGISEEGTTLEANGASYGSTDIKTSDDSFRTEDVETSYSAFSKGIFRTLYLTLSLAQPVSENLLFTYIVNENNTESNYTIDQDWQVLSYAASLKFSLGNHHFGAGIRQNRGTISYNKNLASTDNNTSIRQALRTLLTAEYTNKQYDLGYQYNSGTGFSFGVLTRSKSFGEEGSAKIKEIYTAHTIGSIANQSSGADSRDTDFTYIDPKLTSFGFAWEGNVFTFEARYNIYEEVGKYTTLESYTFNTDNVSSDLSSSGLEDSKASVSDYALGATMLLWGDYTLVGGLGYTASNSSELFLDKDSRKLSLGLNIRNPVGLTSIGYYNVQTEGSSDEYDDVNVSFSSIIIGGKVSF